MKVNDPEHQKDIDDLTKKVPPLNYYLLAVTILTLGASAFLSVYGPTWSGEPRWWGIALCITSGTMGSAVAALLSAQERRANGWEVQDGTKYPKEGPPDKFNHGMVSRFYTRPVLGAVVGAVFYFGAPSVFGFSPRRAQ